MTRVLVMLILAFALASCQVLGGGDGGSSNQGGSNAPVITWVEDPTVPVFRAEVTSGENAEFLYTRNEVPACTIYGDGTIVWTAETESGSRVLVDVLTGEQIRQFVTDLTIHQEIYTHEAGSDFAVPSSEEPVLEKLTLAVNGQTHVTDSLSDWDIDYFQTIVDMCQRIAQSPATFVPDEAWVSAQEVPYNPNAPQIRWDAQASGLDLAAIAQSGERQWIEGQNVRILWNLIRSSVPDLQFSQGASNMYLALEVPNVTMQSPLAPSD